MVRVRQVIEALPRRELPEALPCSGAADFGRPCRRSMRSLGTREPLPSPGSPWQNGDVEGVIGTVRRDCTDPVIVLNERNLRWALAPHPR